MIKEKQSKRETLKEKLGDMFKTHIFFFYIIFMYNICVCIMNYVTKFKLNLRIVKDNDCHVYHPESISYDVSPAVEELFNYIQSKNNPEFTNYCKMNLNIFFPF